MKAPQLIPALVLAVGLTGCGYVIETVAGQVFGGDDRPPGVEAPGVDDRAIQAGSLTKVVADKVPPTTLIARDGSTCEVPRARFDAIQIGQSVVCVWDGADSVERPGPAL